jgi:hypothetical protein
VIGFAPRSDLACFCADQAVQKFSRFGSDLGILKKLFYAVLRMGLLVKIKNWTNQRLEPFNMRIESRAAERAETERLLNLEK